jgi:hypothetical protein
MKSRLDSSFISCIAFSISSFLHKEYHGFVVSRVPIQALIQFTSNSL